MEISFSNSNVTILVSWISVPTGNSIKIFAKLGCESGKNRTFGGNTERRTIEKKSRPTVPKNVDLAFLPRRENSINLVYFLSTEGNSFV